MPEAEAMQARFVLWIHQYGVNRLMREMRLTRTAIHHWAKKRRWPEVDKAAVMIFLSEREPLKQDGRPLTWDDIFGDLAQASVQHYLSDANPASRADVIAAAAAYQSQVRAAASLTGREMQHA